MTQKPLDPDTRVLFEIFKCAEQLPSPREQFEIILTAAVVISTQALNSQLHIPGGHTAEKERQLQMLAKLTRLIREAEPDMEAHRLLLEEDWDGLAQHIKTLHDEMMKPEESEGEE